MKRFLFNGRDYKVMNGLVYEYAGGIGGISPCYEGDNVMLDAHCRLLGMDMHKRLRSKGDKPNMAEHKYARNPLTSVQAYKAMTKQWIPSQPDKSVISIADFSKYGAGRLVKFWDRDENGPEYIGTFFISRQYNIEDIERYAQEWYQGKSWDVPFEVWVKETWHVFDVFEVFIPAIYV